MNPDNKYRFLIIPGLGGSGEEHWQTYWSKELKYAVEVVQDDWENPDKTIWLKRLDEYINRSDQPTILIAHSLAVALVVHWSSLYNNPCVKGILMVAPADVDSDKHTPEVVRGFSPMPLEKLSVPSVVIGSENDDYVSIDRAMFFSDRWGSEFINVGSLGHINSDSKLGSWEFGKQFLYKLTNEISL